MRIFALKKIVSDYAAELKNNDHISQLSARLLDLDTEETFLSLGESFSFLADIVENTNNCKPSFRDFCRTNEFAVPAYVVQTLYNKGALTTCLYIQAMNNRYPELAAYAYANFFEHLKGEINPDAIDELIIELCKEEVALPCYVGNQILLDPDVFYVTKPPAISKWVTYNPFPYEYIISLLNIDPDFLLESSGFRTAYEIMRMFGTWGAGILLRRDNLFSIKDSVNYPQTLVVLQNMSRLIHFDRTENSKEITELVSIISRLNNPLETADLCDSFIRDIKAGQKPNENTLLRLLAQIPPARQQPKSLLFQRATSDSEESVHDGNIQSPSAPEL